MTSIQFLDPGRPGTERPALARQRVPMRRQLAAKLGAGLMWLGLALGSAAGSAVAATPQDLGGQVRAEVDGKVIQFPSLKTDITADVQGDLADVTVVQTFVNPVAKPLNATIFSRSTRMPPCTPCKCA